MDRLVGGTPREVRAALGVPTSDDFVFFDEASVVDGVQTINVRQRKIFSAENPCPASYTRHDVQARLGERPLAIVRFVFRDGRLAEVISDPPDASEGPLPADAVVRVQCQDQGRGGAAQEAFLTAGALVSFSPLIVAGAIAAPIAAATDESDLRVRALSALRLGQALPGGVDGYQSRYAEALTIVRRDGEDADLLLALGDGDGPEQHRLFGIQVREGIVRGVVAPSHRACIVATDAAISCARR